VTVCTQFGKFSPVLCCGQFALMGSLKALQLAKA
jgi:hypothetical protein